MRRIALLAAASIAFATPTQRADAADTVKSLVSDAKAKARASDNAAAAPLFGAAIALAQKQGDLFAEEEAGDALVEFLERLPAPPVEGGKEVASTVGGAREAMAAVLGKLDPKRIGAFVSAPALAGELLILAIGKGDGRFVKEAALALEPHAKGGKPGLGLATLAKLAAAVRDGQGEGAGKSDPPLQAVVDGAIAEDWIDLAMAAGVEQAAQRMRVGDSAKPKDAIEALARMVTPKTEFRLCSWLRTAADVRFKGASADLLKPLTDALAARSGGSVAAAGGRGGAGAPGSSSPNPVSPLGDALRKAPKGSPMATVLRTKEGFEFRVSWDPKFKKVHQHQDGVKHLDEGGLTVSVLDWSVALRMADPVGTNGQPGESSHPDPGRAFYRIARGESWALRSDGSIVIAAGK